MKILPFFLLLFFIGTVAPVSAQQTKEAGLQKAFLNAEEDSTAKKRLDDLFLFYKNDTSKSAEEHLHQLQLLIQKKGSKLSYCLLPYRVLLTHTSDSIAESRKCLQEFLKQARSNNDKQSYLNGLMFLSQKESYVGNYNEALKLLLQSLDYATDTLKDCEMIGGVFCSLGILYAEQGDTIKTIYYYKKAMESAVEVDNIASNSNNLGMVYKEMGQYDTAKFYYRKAISLFQQMDRGGLLPNPLGNLADLFRVTHQYDSALYYARKCISVATQLNFTLATGSGYFTTAQIFRDMGKADSAMLYYSKAKKTFEKNVAQFALRDFYLDLASFYSSLHDYKPAYEYLSKATAIKDSVFSSENNKKLAQLSMQYDFDKKETADKAEQEKKDIQQRNIRYSIAGALIVALLFLAVVYYQGNKVKKEKARSEELLLNILPEAVAEELKQKGTADAKLFENVTVFFSDFVSFTTVSEKLSPQQLVNELHECFSAFDHIMYKYGIEKIKTVGDAYLAVSGLPTANPNHAQDMVNAALEIQQFILTREPKAPFGGLGAVRIGIHSGSVVAGIVGVKKFAYDIWGDTVNTAARMEQNGEAGKVNISEATYELVKDKFKTEYRGEIEAKNKGKLKMYFIV